MQTRLRPALCAIAWSVCGGAASMAQPLPFTEEAAARGVSFNYATSSQAARGLALVDLNNDGFPDLVAPGGINNVVGLWQNDATGHFIDRRSGSGIAAFTAASGIVAGDYDADGDLDLYLSRWWTGNVLLRNDGDFRFTNVTSAARVSNIDGATMGCTWGDFDADGWVDLYVSNFSNIVQPRLNALYRNNRDGTFSDVAVAHGVADVGYTWQSAFVDLDRDMRPDLYVSNDKGYELPACSRRNYLFHNIGGAFEDVSFASGTAACIESMGLAVGDFDNNGRPDIYITNTELGNHLLSQTGEMPFEEVGLPMGVRSFDVGWGAVFFDANNDGALDIYVCNTGPFNRLYIREGDVFVDRAVELGVGMAGVDSQVVAVGDIDHDGDLDLVVQGVAHGSTTHLRMFINHSGEQGNWSRLRVVGAPPNRFAFGASVDVRTGALLQTRDVLGAGGFKSHDDVPLHVGLGAAGVMEEIVVRWPAGAAGAGEGGELQPHTRTLINYPANHPWTLYPDCMLGGADPVTGELTSENFFAFLQCFFAAEKGLVPGCEIMDMNGDAQLTSTDFFEFLTRFFR